jgi:hypothetical protein
MAFPNDRTYSFDINLVLSDGIVPLTATGYAQANGQSAILDLGGNQGTNPQQRARIDAVAVIDVTTIKTSAGNEKYNLMVLVSNDPAFGAGNVEMAAEISLGAGAARDGINMLTSPIGRIELPFCTQIAGMLYEFAALYIVEAGTLPSITVSSFVAVLMEP